MDETNEAIMMGYLSEMRDTLNMMYEELVQIRKAKN